MYEINFRLFIPLFLKIKISELFWNFKKKNWVVISIIKGNISNKTDGKFNNVKKIGKPRPIWSFPLKNFSSSNILKINTNDAKTKVILSFDDGYKDFLEIAHPILIGRREKILEIIEDYLYSKFTINTFFEMDKVFYFKK